MVATEKAYVSGFTTVAGSEGKGAAYLPKLSTVSSGLVLDLQATISRDRKHVTMTLRPQISRLDRMEEFPFDKDNKLTLQRPVVSVNALRTTASVAEGQTLVFSGFSSKTVEGAAPAGGNVIPPDHEPAAVLNRAGMVGAAGNELEGFGPGRRVLLLVRPTIILPESPARERATRP